VCFCNGTMKSFFFLTVQIGMKFGQKNVNQCPLLNLNRRIMTIFSGVVLTGFSVTGLQARVTFFDLAEPSVY